MVTIIFFATDGYAWIAFAHLSRGSKRHMAEIGVQIGIYGFIEGQNKRTPCHGPHTPDRFFHRQCALNVKSYVR